MIQNGTPFYSYHISVNLVSVSDIFEVYTSFGCEAQVAVMIIRRDVKKLNNAIIN